MNNINNSQNNQNIYETKLMKINNRISEIQNQIVIKTDHNSSSNKEIIKMDKAQSEEVLKFSKKIQEEIQKAELIAVKIVKRENITQSELDFITKKYPDINEIAKQAVKESKDLKQVLDNCKTEKEKKQVLLKAINNIKNMLQKNKISQMQANIKIVSIEELKKLNISNQKELNKVDIIMQKIVKGKDLTKEELSFITKKYPELKQTIEKTIKDIKHLKQNLRQDKTIQQKEKLINKAINNTKENLKANKNSNTQTKINKLQLKELKNISKELKKDLKKLEVVAVKIIRGKKITSKEQYFIIKNEPKLKKSIEEYKTEYKQIKLELKNSKIYNQRQQIILEKSNNIRHMVESRAIPEIEGKVKLLALEELSVEGEEPIDNSKEIKFNLNPYIYLTQKQLMDKVPVIIVLIVIASIIYIV